MTELSRLRCAVLGAGGFIGTNLCHALAGEVRSLRALGRGRHSLGALHGLNWMSGDFADPTCLANVVADCDVVFHLVNTTTPVASNADKVADICNNVVGTLQLLEACRAARVGRIIFVSSGGTIYGIPSQVPTPETAPTNPITAYGVSKLAIEKYLHLYEHMYGLECRILRVANPFGPHQTASKDQGAIAAFVRRVLAGQPIEVWGDGSVTRDYIYVEDVVEALKLASTHSGDGRVFNVGRGEGRSLRQVITAIQAAIDAPVAIRYRAGRQVDVPVSVLDVSYAARELGWTSRTRFEDGLRKTVTWNLEQQMRYEAA